MVNHKQKQYKLLSGKAVIALIICLMACSELAHGQCLSSVNPVGGTENLLALEKKSLRFITFYKYGQGTQYFEGHQHSDFDLIKKGYYNYLSAIIGYGIGRKLTLEIESGYYLNKTQVYDTEPEYKLTGKGFSNVVTSLKYSLYTNHMKRIYFSASLGAKIPCSRTPQSQNNVQLPVEVQPTIGSYGLVFNSSFVKENTAKGLRYFMTNRVQANLPNKDDYRLGTAIFNSLYISKHLMFNWLPGDWTTILQVRNEIRFRDEHSGKQRESTGGVLFFLVPQINFMIKENWNVSTMVDIPVYQYFHGTQLGSDAGFTISLSRTVRLVK